MHIIMMIFKNQNVLFVSFSIKVYITKLMIDTDLVLYTCNFEDVTVGAGLTYYKDIAKVFYK